MWYGDLAGTAVIFACIALKAKRQRGGYIVGVVVILIRLLRCRMHQAQVIILSLVSLGLGWQLSLFFRRDSPAAGGSKVTLAVIDRAMQAAPSEELRQQLRRTAVLAMECLDDDAEF